jgi:hypothetical protein
VTLHLVERAMKFSSNERSIFVELLTGDVPLILQLRAVPHQEKHWAGTLALLLAIRSIEEGLVGFRNKINIIIGCFTFW